MSTVSASAPMTIGGIAIRNRVFLAPMSGISDLPFRRLAWRYGAGLVVTEMIASRELVGGSRDSLSRLAGEGVFPHVVQLAGREAGWMADAARCAVDHGADIIDINMGCPAKKVTGGYSGSALMRDPDHALSLIRATIAAVRVPVTLKMRLGWDENCLTAVEIARRAEAEGIAMITVHGRTRCQFYEGRADWPAIARVREAVSIPFVANGDIADGNDVERALAVTGADAVMVGRAAEGRPWLPGVLAGAGKAPSDAAEIVALVREHYERMLAHYGEAIGVRQARKHLARYLDHHAPGASPALRAALMTGRNPHDVLACIEEAFAGPGAQTKPLRREAA